MTSSPIGVLVAVCAGLALRRPEQKPERTLMIGWLAAAVVGFAAVGTFVDRYALGLLAPVHRDGACWGSRDRAFRPARG